MNINQRVEIVNFNAFNEVKGTIVEKLQTKYSQNTNKGFLKATSDLTEDTLYLVRFDCPIWYERNGFAAAEELMVFSTVNLRVI